MGAVVSAEDRVLQAEVGDLHQQQRVTAFVDSSQAFVSAIEHAMDALSSCCRFSSIIDASMPYSSTEHDTYQDMTTSSANSQCSAVGGQYLQLGTCKVKQESVQPGMPTYARSVTGCCKKTGQEREEQQICSAGLPLRTMEEERKEASQ